MRISVTTLRITPAGSAADIEAARTLMTEYQAELGVDLCFQRFDAELRALPGAYAPPSGRLLIARHDEHLFGCVALRAAGDGRCEMKRLFVRPAGRALGIGHALVQHVLDEARALGYAEIVLDTLPSLIAAQRMYEAFGFRDIPAYCDNPLPGARYLGLRL